MAEQSSEKTADGFNTDQQYIAGVYAKSLIAATEKVGNTEEVLEQLHSFVVDVLGSISKLDSALKSPRISPEEKGKMVDLAIGGKADKMLVNFLKVLANHERLDCLAAIDVQARELFNEMRGKVEASVTVADELPESLHAAVQAKLKSVLGKDVILSVRKDPQIIGGMIVKVGDTVYDSSVANQLSQVREVALDKTMQQVRGSLESFVTDGES